MLVLYVFGAFLPIAGIGLTLFRVSLRARQHRHRAGHKRALQFQRNKKTASDASDEELELINEWHHAELAKRDKWGLAYSCPDSGITSTGPGIEAVEGLGKLWRDAGFIGGGLLAGTTASIWSLFL